MRFFLILLILFVLYLFSLRGRRGHAGLEALRGWNYAHRGLHSQERPENSLSAFRAAVAGGYGAEFDVHLLSDGGLAVIHDSTLKRTTGAEGRVEDLTTGQLKDYHLEGTAQTIPTFREVLDIFQGKAPVVIELKAANNAAALCEAVCNALDGYNGVYCLESFDPRCLIWLKKNRPELIRGQLAENCMKNGAHYPFPWILRFVLANCMENFLTKPDFVAYKFEDRRNLSVRLCNRAWGIQGVSWTIRSKADFDTAVAENRIPIFENFEP